MSSAVDKVLERVRNSLQAKADINRSFQAASRIQSKRMQALELFRPFSYQDQFLHCTASEVLVRGGTRSGKSTIIAAAIASYALNKPITDSFGLRINMREEQFADKTTGEIWIIGKQMNHSSTIYRLLFQPGAFWIVRDKKTHKWRAWQPGVIEGDDQIPEVDRKQAPPLIYPGDVKFGWEKQREKQWNTAELPNGWTIKYYPSNGAPKRGDPVHRIWIDEDIESDALYPELQSRLSDFKGRIWWSSWPDLRCQPLIDLYERAVEDMDNFASGRSKHLDTVEMRFRGSDNPVVDSDEKRKRNKGWDENTARARDEGEFNRESIKTYPEFQKNFHVVDYGETSPKDDKLAQVLRARNWTPPSDWAVDLILDPGTQRPALLWVAIPPEEFWYGGKPYYVPYRELTGRYDAEQLAYQVRHMDPGRVYNRWIIDSKCGDQTPPGATFSICDNYTTAFKAQGLHSAFSQGMFLPGETAWIVRSMCLRKMMQPIAQGANKPQLRIVAHQCPTLMRQIDRNLRHVQKEDVQDKRASGQVQDLLDCLEYFAGSGPEYNFPPPAPVEETPGFRSWKGEQTFWDSLTGTKQNADRNAIVCGIP